MSYGCVGREISLSLQFCDVPLHHWMTSREEETCQSQKCSYLERDSASLLWQNYICVACNKIESDPFTVLFMLFDTTEVKCVASCAHCIFHLSCIHAQGPPGPPGPQGADVSEFDLNKLGFTECTVQIKESTHLI